MLVEWFDNSFVYGDIHACRVFMLSLARNVARINSNPQLGSLCIWLRFPPTLEAMCQAISAEVNSRHVMLGLRSLFPSEYFRLVDPEQKGIHRGRPARSRSGGSRHRMQPKLFLQPDLDDCEDARRLRDSRISRSRRRQVRLSAWARPV